MKRLLPLAFALLKFVSGFFLNSPAYDLHRDEYLYLNHGRHLAWGYLEVPPLSAAQGWLSLALGGDVGWVRCWPYLWGAATLYLVMCLTQRLGGGWLATALAGTCYLGTAFARLNLLFQPNSFEVFGFVFCLYWLAVYCQHPRPRYLYLPGLGLGLGLLNKYTTLFFGAALAGGLLLSPARRLLLSRHWWGALTLALLLWLPNLAWQLVHGIPFRHHMQLLRASQLVHVEAAEFWKMQLLMCLAAVWVWVPGLLALLFSPALRPWRALGWVPVLGVGMLVALHGKDYYALGYYPVLFSFGAWWWEQRLRHWSRPGSRASGERPSGRLVAGPGWQLAGLVLVLIPLALMGPLLPFIYPVRPPAAMRALRPQYAPLGLYRWEDGQDHELPQDYADMRGWHELADHVWAAWQRLPDSVRAHTLIKCSNYGQASAVNYYNRARPLPPAQSYNGSFLYWFPKRSDWQAIIIVDDELHPELAAHFADYHRVAVVADPYARERGTSVIVGRQPDASVRQLILKELAASLVEWENPTLNEGGLVK